LYIKICNTQDITKKNNEKSRRKAYPNAREKSLGGFKNR
jgi:hypothetical protein